MTLNLISVFVLPVAGFTQPSTYSDLPQIERNGAVQEQVSKLIGRSLTNRERLLISHMTYINSIGGQDHYEVIFIPRNDFGYDEIKGMFDKWEKAVRSKNPKNYKLFRASIIDDYPTFKKVELFVPAMPIAGDRVDGYHDLTYVEHLKGGIDSNTNPAMMSSMAKFLAVASLFAASFFVSPAAGFAQTFPQTHSPEIPYINRNGHLQDYIRQGLPRPLMERERLFIGHLIGPYKTKGTLYKWELDKEGKKIFGTNELKTMVLRWIAEERSFIAPGYIYGTYEFYFEWIPVPQANTDDGKRNGNLADATTKGGIDLDTKDMSFTSTGVMDQAVLQQLPNIRPQDIIGISITNITISPIPSLPRLLGMDDSESDEPEESLAKMELSYLKED